MVPWAWHPDVPQESVELEIPSKPVWFKEFDERVATSFEKLPGQRRHMGCVNGGLFYSSGKGACLRLARTGGKTEKAPTKLTNLVDICGYGELVAIADFQGQLGIGNFGMNRTSRQQDVILRHPRSASVSPTSPATLPSPTATPYFTHLEWLSKTSLIAMCSNSSIFELDINALSTRTVKNDEPLDLSEGVRHIREASHPQPQTWTSHVTPNRSSGTVSAISHSYTTVETYRKEGEEWNVVNVLKAHDGAKIHAVHSVSTGGIDYLVTISVHLNMRIWDLSEELPRLTHDMTLFKEDDSIKVSKESTRLCSFLGGRFSLYWEEAIQLVFELTPSKGSGRPELSAWRQDVGSRLELGALTTPSSLCVLFSDRLAVTNFNCTAANAVSFRHLPFRSCLPESPKASPLPPPSFVTNGEEENKLVKVMDQLRVSLTQLTGTCNEMSNYSSRVADLAAEIHQFNSEPKEGVQVKYDALLSGCEVSVEGLDKGGGQTADIIDTVGKKVQEIQEEAAKDKAKLEEEMLSARRDVGKDVKKFRDDVYNGMISPELQGLRYRKKQKARGLVRSEFENLKEIEVASLEAISELSTSLLSEHIKAAHHLGSTLSAAFSSAAQEAATHGVVEPTFLPLVSDTVSPSLDELPSVVVKLTEQYQQACIKREQQLMQQLDEMYREPVVETMPREDSVMPDDSISVAAWAVDHKAAWSKLIEAGKYVECIYQINTHTAGGHADEMAWFLMAAVGVRTEVLGKISIEATFMLIRAAAMCLDANPNATVALDWLIAIASDLDLGPVHDKIDKSSALQLRYAEDIASQILPGLRTLQSDKASDLDIAIMALQSNADLLESL